MLHQCFLHIRNAQLFDMLLFANNSQPVVEQVIVDGVDVEQVAVVVNFAQCLMMRTHILH